MYIRERDNLESNVKEIAMSLLVFMNSLGNGVIDKFRINWKNGRK